MAIIEMLRREGCSGATAIRGVAGFGASSLIHTAAILRLSLDQPLVITVGAERVQGLLLVLIGASKAFAGAPAAIPFRIRTRRTRWQHLFARGRNEKCAPVHVAALVMRGFAHGQTQEGASDVSIEVGRTELSKAMGC